MFPKWPQSSEASLIAFLFLFFFLISVLTSSLTVLSKSFRISRMRSPSELEVVDSASGDRLAIIGDDRGVSKSSSDNGLVNGLAAVEEVFAATVGFALEAAPAEVAFTDTASVVFGIEGALI